MELDQFDIKVHMEKQTCKKDQENIKKPENFQEAASPSLHKNIL